MYCIYIYGLDKGAKKVDMLLLFSDYFQKAQFRITQLQNSNSNEFKEN